MKLSECKVGQRVYLCPILVRKVKPTNPDIKYDHLGTIESVSEYSVLVCWDKGRYYSIPSGKSIQRYTDDSIGLLFALQLVED